MFLKSESDVMEGNFREVTNRLTLVSFRMSSTRDSKPARVMSLDSSRASTTTDKPCRWLTTRSAHEMQRVFEGVVFFLLCVS